MKFLRGQFSAAFFAIFIAGAVASPAHYTKQKLTSSSPTPTGHVIVIPDAFIKYAGDPVP
ncbi:hypothetical protein D9619_000146 [Psilocybe cf. subviscida]|uniref:Uncharacterized protein n=1 Tax=Psilocybe cf. subviscida TaxID=2480587 RepID=A0A8H5F3G2_9AGAR|nr:hypothetical protein D9619_000146 [Psilocybe cf. subviscida]